MLYDLAFRRLATRVEAERAHAAGTAAMRAAARLPGGLAAVRAGVRLAAQSPVRGRDGAPAAAGSAVAAAVDAMGLRFRSPLGLAAGFDKDARAVATLAALGFGSVEVGTVTPRPQPGNPAPRLFRLPADRALVNRMGFNNAGADAVARRLGALRAGGTLPPGFVVGVNVGKNRDTPGGRAADDFAAVARVCAPVADYVVVNVSSPNTPGLRDLQAVDALRPVLSAVLAQAAGRPVLVKIAPDLADADVDAVTDLAGETGLAGVVAANTTLSRAGLGSAEADVARAGRGGLSGPPLLDRALAVVERVAARAAGRLTVVAVGGISSAEDVRRARSAGAVLVQAYTAFVYGGPAWPGRVTRGLG